MGIAAFGVYQLAAAVTGANGRFGMLLCMALAILAAIGVYLFTVIRTGCVTNDDLKLIPGGEKVGRFLHMR